MKTRELLCLLPLLALVAGGCAYQKPDVRSSETPDWVLQKPADTPDQIFYVGLGCGESIVDSQGARATAMKDVCRQVARSLTPVVVEQAIAIADQKGLPHGSQDAEGARYEDQVREQVDQAAPGIQQEGFYWERWAYKQGAFNPCTYDYRYYILASMSREMAAKLTTELVHRIANDMEVRAEGSPAS